MGCTSSISYTKQSCKHFHTYIDAGKSHVIFAMKHPAELTTAERSIVRQTWLSLAKDLQGNGLQLFLRIFELCPEVKALFSVENVRHSQLARNETIIAHGALFASALGLAVDSLDERDQKDNKLNKFLFNLGQQHKRFTRFKPVYFEIFYEALMCQWEHCMGDQFTQEVSDAWSHLFVFVIEKLKEGYFSKEVSFEAHLRSK